MTSYQIGWFSSICHLHGLVIFREKIAFSADQMIIQKTIFQSLNHVYINLKPKVLIKSGYYIVPSPSTALVPMYKFAITFRSIFPGNP